MGLLETRNMQLGPLLAAKGTFKQPNHRNEEAAHIRVAFRPKGCLTSRHLAVAKSLLAGLPILLKGVVQLIAKPNIAIQYPGNIE